MDRGRRLFDVYMAVDWSARRAPSSRRPSADAVWMAEAVAVSEGEEESCARRVSGGVPVEARRPSAHGAAASPSGTTETYWRTRTACRAHLHERLRYHTVVKSPSGTAPAL